MSADKRSWGSLTSIGPDTIADIVESVSPFVVNIDVSLSRQTVEPKQRKGKGGRAIEPGQTPGKITGSGVIVRADGLILTSSHVIEDAEKVRVTLSDGRSFSASVVGEDAFSDLALVRVPAAELPVARFGNSDNLRTGDWVLAVGSPLGLDHSVTLGIISALGREATSFKAFGARSGAVRYIQTDAAINNGNSGGPLLNLKGEVIGINSFVHGSAQNIGFAIPANLAQDVADKLAKFQTIAHPFIGIVMDDSDDQQVMVRSVAPGSPAYLAGLLAGDVILQVDEQQVKHSSHVSQVVRSHAIGDYMKIKVKRDEGERLFKVQVEQLPENAHFQ